MEELDCSPTNRERELGLDRRETGWFYPPATASAFREGGSLCESSVGMTVAARGSTRGTLVPHLWFLQ